METDFDGVVAWLRARLGRQVVAATQGAGDGAVSNTALSVAGPLLLRDEGDITLIDPPPGRVEAFAVGAATLVLLEGDFAGAATAGLGGDRGAPLLQARFGDLLVTVAEVVAGGEASL